MDPDIQPSLHQGDPADFRSATASIIILRPRKKLWAACPQRRQEATISAAEHVVDLHTGFSDTLAEICNELETELDGLWQRFEGESRRWLYEHV